MDNREAIASLRTLCHNCKLFPKCAYEKPECFEAIELAISALQAQETINRRNKSVQNVNIDDSVTRKEVKELSNNSPKLDKENGDLKPTCNKLATDTISRQEVVDAINEICERCGEGKKYNGVMCGACNLDGVADIVEDLPSAQPEPCKDAVSRADVVDMLEMFPFTEYSEYETAREVVKRLPSAHPEIEERKEESAQNVPKEDLISRKVAIDALKNERSDWNCDYNVPVDHCIDAIYSVPSAQPDPHYCRECKWNQCHINVDKYGNTETYWHCLNWDGGTDEEGYCYEWERKDEGSD